MSETPIILDDPQTIQMIGDASIAFSISCVDCDAGGDIGSLPEAIAAGWRGIIYDDGPTWNYAGKCPECGKGKA